MNLYETKTPLLGKGGVAAPSSKWSRSFAGAAGVVRSTSDNRWLEPTTPSAPAMEASRHFLMGAPLLIQGGEFRLCLFSSFAANCLAKSGSLKVLQKGSSPECCVYPMSSFPVLSPCLSTEAPAISSIVRNIFVTGVPFG